MRNRGVHIIQFLLICSLTSCQSRSVTTDFNPVQAMSFVEQQLAFGPRIPGTEGHAETANWIEATVADYGWSVRRQSFQYRGTTITNIIASSSTSSTDPVLILGAHYDTRPHANLDEQQPLSPVPGANDGASGVAVLLEIARTLPPGSLSYPLMLVFFDAEDSGGIDGWDWIVGSTYFAEHLDRPCEGVVIVDMVGDQDLYLPLERTSDPSLQASIWLEGQRSGFPAYESREGYAIIDDHTPFLQRGIPAVDIIDFDYPAWHTRADTLDQLSTDSLEQVGQTLVNWLLARNLMINEGTPEQ